MLLLRLQSHCLLMWWEKEKSELLMDVFCVSSFSSLLSRSSSVSVVFDFSASLNAFAPVSPMLLSVDVKWNEKVICWWMPFVCLLSLVFTLQIEFSECCAWFQWFTQWCCSYISNVVVCWWEHKWKEWIVDGCLLCVFFLLSSLFRLSLVSVVFDFNTSLNDVAPVSPISLSVDVMINGKRWIVDGRHLCLSFVFTSQI